MTIQILRQWWPQTETAKSHPHLHHRRNCKTKEHWIATGHWTGHHHCNFLCHAIMWVSESHPSREVTNWHTLPLQSLFFQGQETDRSQQPAPWILRLHIDHLWDAEERQKEQHRHLNVTGRHQHVPCQDGSCHHPQNQILLRSQQRHPLSAFWQFNHINHVTLKQVLAAMNDTIQAIGKDVLHFKKEETVMLSIRSGAAMAIFLGNCLVCLIMMIGRWSSNTFLQYIRKTVQTIQPQCFQKNNQAHVPLPHPNIHNSFSFPPRPEAREQPQQCQDKKEHRWQHDSTSQASSFCAPQLSQSCSTDRGTQI
jgi:hypothetical protein